MDTSVSKHVTMTQALEATKENGFDVEKIVARATDNKIVWDSANDCFAYIEKGKSEPTYIPDTKTDASVADYQLWTIVDSKTLDAKYSSYIAGTSVSGAVEATKGVDVGENTGITAVSYTNTGDKQDVVIRTNGGKLTINDANADSEQIHYGILSSAEVTTGTSCFYTHGIIGTMDLKAGKVVADKDSYVGLTKAAEGTKVVEQNGGVFVIPEDTATSDIPATVAEQLSGYSVSDGKIVANETREANSFYCIGSLEQLNAFRDGWNNGTITIKKVKLTADFDLSGSNWYPIGTWEWPFNGTFDGNGHTINGLYANSIDSDHKGLYANGDSVGFGETYGFFGIVGNGDTSISNINFTNVSINIFDGKDVGAVVGYVPSNAKFISAGPKSTPDDRNHDGFISYHKWQNDSAVGTHALTLNGITVSGSVTGDSHVAGLVGKIYTTGDIAFTNCVNKASVNGAGGYIGGLVGIQSSLTKSFKLTNCANEGNITASSKAVGVAGLVGRVNDNQEQDENRTIDFVIEGCTNSGNINSSVSAAVGLIFCNSVKSVLIKDCSNTGNVTSFKESATGIITQGTISQAMTYEGTIKNSGNVSGIASASGIGLSLKTVLKNATIINSGAVQATNDGSKKIGNYAGGLASSFSGTLTVEGTSSFENTGNISVTTVWGEAYTGGVFGQYSNSSDTATAFALPVNVHNCSISGIGAGRWFHNTGYGADVMKNDPVAVGGFAGRVSSKFVTYSNIKVDSVAFSASASETTKKYEPSGGTAPVEPTVREQFMAGSFVGIMNISVDSNTQVDNQLTNAKLTNNTFDSKYKGIIVGCSYNSYSATAKVALRYSGTFMNLTDDLQYNGLVYNNASIEALTK